MEETHANQKPWNHARYEVRVGRKKVHGEITTDLARRTGEHQRNRPSAKVTKVGPKVAEDTARQWERDKGYS